MQQTDPFGIAIKDYYQARFRWGKKLVMRSSLSGIEKTPVSYYFRSFRKMPLLERQALDLCEGSVLDVGACAGSHALLLQNRGFDVTALDISKACCEVMLSRGIKSVVCSDINNYKSRKFNTILLLMNGIGMAGTLKELPHFLNHLKNLLLPGGQILFDSCDIDYAYYEPDGSKWVDLNNAYYGQVKYTPVFKHSEGQDFNWLFVDSNKMKAVARLCGFNFTILAEGSQSAYLGKLIIQG
ncbi:MAG: methyltransferase domain-containing protein [Bacteroidota bacterium]|nr:MAG: methyltransferase domain-containing protein [Bacteroidota bacterium]